MENTDKNHVNSENADQPENGSLPDCDATYRLEYNEDGVFLLANYGTTDGKPLQSEVVLYDLKRREISGIVDDDIRHGIKWRKENIRIADAQKESVCDSDMMILISHDHMSAEMVLLPPCGEGNTKSSDELAELIVHKWGISFGVDEQMVKKAADNPTYYIPILIAQGKPPQKGEDGSIIFLFKTEHSYAPKITGDGSADYKSLSIFEGVLEGATVATVTSPEKGVEGCNVKGDILPPKPGADAKLPRLKNIKVTQDGKSLIALKSGRIDYINSRIEISDVYKISGDVDMSVGNIRFEGDVIVSGDVISGLSIEAAGMIEVKGYVEAATLIAGKDIVLKNGMQGANKGKIVAGGNVVARFLEHCDIQVKGSLTADYIVHCNVTAGESITMKGKWCKIVGGTVIAAKEITANVIGSVSNELTVVELGTSPESRTRYSELLNEKNRIREQLEKINSVAKVFSAHNESSDRQEMREKLVAAKKQLEQQYKDTVAEIESLEKILSTNSGARLNVYKSIYPNVKLTIDSCLTTIKKTTDYATFRYSKGEIIFTACEAKP